MTKSLFTAFVAVFALTHCSDSVKSGENQISGFSYRSLAQGFNIFDAALSGDENDFDLKFKIQDNGVFTFVANSDDKLEKGINFVFSRRGNQLEVLIGVASNPESVDASREVQGRLGNLDGELNIKLTVHNGEGGSSHIILKDAAGATLLSLEPAGERHAGPQNAVGRLFQPLEKTSPGKGAGLNFGFGVENSSFTSMAVSKSDEHE